MDWKNKWKVSDTNDRMVHLQLLNGFWISYQKQADGIFLNDLRSKMDADNDYVSADEFDSQRDTI